MRAAPIEVCGFGQEDARVTIMILGAAGFLGSWTTRAAVAGGNDVVAVSRESSDRWRLRDAGGVSVAADPAAWPDLIAAHRPDSIVLLDWAGVAAVDRADESVQLANLERQRTVLDAAIASGVSRVVGVGSQAEYGPRDDRVAETTPIGPVTEYGRAKVAALEALRARAESAGLSWTWARVFSVYGPLEADGALLPSIANAVATGTRIPLGAGGQGWSYLHAADAGTALTALATSARATGVYNVGHPEDPPLRESIMLFAREIGGTHLLGFGERAVVETRLAPDTSRLQDLGWAPRFGIASGLPQTARWMAGDPVADPFDHARTLPERPRGFRPTRGLS